MFHIRSRLRRPLPSSLVHSNVHPTPTYSTSARTASESLIPLLGSNPPARPKHFPSQLRLVRTVQTRTFPTKSTASQEELNDRDFNDLAPLDQVKLALSLPRPTTFPRLEWSILDSAIKITSGGEAPVDATPKDFPFCSIKQLAFYGDRLWGEVVVNVLLAMRLSSDPLCRKKKAGRLALGAGLLVTNELAANLARELGKGSFYERGTSEGALADLWEAYLAALYYEKGRQPLLKFLVPLVKSEHDKLVQVKLEGSVKTREKEVSTALFKAIIAFKEKKAKRKEKQKVENNTVEAAISVSAKTSHTIADHSVPVLSPAKEVPQHGTSALEPVLTARTREEERLRILAMSKIPAISFASREAAVTNLVSTLEGQGIPFLYTVSPNKRRVSLQLPGVPLLAARSKKKQKSKALTKLVNEAFKLGHFKGPKPSEGKQSKEIAVGSKPIATLKGSGATSLKNLPLVFSTPREANASFFKKLAARKIQFTYEKVDTGSRLNLPGFEPIVSDAATKAARRSAFVKGAIALGAIKLKPTRAST